MRAIRALISLAAIMFPEAALHAGPQSLVFVQGANGYVGTRDTTLDEGEPDTSFGDDFEVFADASLVHQGLLLFDDVVGQGSNRIPPGSTIIEARLELTISNPGPPSTQVHRMLLPWTEDDTWNSWDNGIDLPRVEFVGPSDATIGFASGVIVVDVTVSLLAWLDAPDSNYGWVFRHDGGTPDGWGFWSSEVPDMPDRPRLIVTFTVVAGLDIKPGSCPNSFNNKGTGNGKLPVALVGTDDIDVTMVDTSTLLLSRADGVGGSVTPLMGPPGPGITISDTATPFDGELCDCHELEGDGIADLNMKFHRTTMTNVLELGDLPGNSMVELEVTGTLLDGTEFAERDCIRLVPPGDIDGDGEVGVADLLGMLATWGPCPAPPANCVADFDESGDVGIPDFLILLGNWG